ncbi:MAG: isochorismatase family protein [Cryobacterium sp.]|nr:isochorismatase family protein [Cryobacterium sp.]
MAANLTRALILVDLQNDFCEGGSLAVAGGAEVARRISAHVLGHAGEYAAIVATADWHDDPGAHFSEHPDFVDTWPAHCRIGTDGALFHPAAEPAFEHVEAIFRKGNQAAAYSGFEGFTTEDGKRVPLAEWLRDRAVEQVDVVGLATDHCVRATALDAAEEGFETTVLLALTAGVARKSADAAIEAMGAAEIELVGEPFVS